MNILKIKDPQGNWVDIPALKGDKGDKGDPGLSPTIDSTLSQANQAADAKTVGDALNTKADQNGYYENLNVGVADQLASKNYIEDNEAYTFRPTGGGAKVGTREFDTIVGGSIVWNQLVDDTNSSVMVTSGHKYIAKIDDAYSVAVSDGTAVAVTGGMDEVFDVTQMLGSEIANHIYSLEQATVGAGVVWFRKYFPNDYYEYNPGELIFVSGLQSRETVDFNQWDEEWQLGLYDVFGNWAARNDYFSSKNMIPVIPSATYYFNHGKSTSSTYYICYYDADGNFIVRNAYLLKPSKESFTVPSNAHFINFTLPAYDTIYNHDICINISDTRDGEYEPYVKHSYPLDSSLTLRGIPKLVDGKLAFDGDVYKPNGTVERRYGIVDLGTLTWYYNTSTEAFSAPIFAPYERTTDTVLDNAICTKYLGSTVRAAASLVDGKFMLCGGSLNSVYVKDSAYTDAATFKTAVSGVYLVYELAEPTTEQAAPYQSPQIIDPYGTEEYVTTSIVPVGHQTQYPEDLRAKIESLPWDFANLIAPVETTYIATQNYTAGSLFIINNILYKATVNIANGGTITPNTNCTTTTLAEIIAAL